MTTAKKVWITIGTLLVAFIMYANHISNDPYEQEKSKARRGIEACWQMHDQKSNTNADKRFIATACEGMEKKFVETYRVKP